MQIKVLSKIIGENAAVGLVGLMFGDEGKIEFAEQIDSERLLSAVNSEANMDVRLKKASVLIAALKTSREKLMAAAKKAAAAETPDENSLKTYAAQIADLDKNIASLQASLDGMAKGKTVATKIVNQIQAQVQTNLVKDQILLSNKEFNSIKNEQLEFTEDMVKALPKSNIGGKLRGSVEKKVETEGMFADSKLEVLRRLMEQQGDAPTEELDEAGQAVLAEITGKK